MQMTIKQIFRIIKKNYQKECGLAYNLQLLSKSFHFDKNKFLEKEIGDKLAKKKISFYHLIYLKKLIVFENNDSLAIKEINKLFSNMTLKNFVHGIKNFQR
jgi:hypothetical protein